VSPATLQQNDTNVFVCNNLTCREVVEESAASIANPSDVVYNEQVYSMSTACWRNAVDKSAVLPSKYAANPDNMVWPQGKIA
jgi:hypothetical protein